MAATNAIMPIILLIVLGYVLKRIHFLSADFLKTANKLVFRVFLPVLLFYNVYNISELKAIRWDIVLYSVIIILVVFCLGLLTAVLFIRDPKQRGVILQCTYRSNFAIIGITLAESLGGTEAVAIAAIISAFSIPVFNILAVISLSIFVGGDDKKIDIRDILLKIVKNPLIIGVVTGLAFLGTRALIPTGADGVKYFTIQNNIPFLYAAIGNVSKIASPLALIVLGGQFEFSAIKGMLSEIVIGTVWRIVLAPAIGIGIAILLSCYTDWISLGVNEYPALIALFGSPAAVSSAIMAGEMDNDDQLAGQLVVWTSVGSVATLFITVFLLMNMGLLTV